jgi:hypothetical protein
MTKEFCVLNAFNPLFKYTNDINTNMDIDLSLPLITVFDKLHTVNKGVVELCLRWSVGLVIAVAKIDKVFSNSLGELDKRIKKFPVGQSIAPFGNYRFWKGVSILFNESTNRDLKSINSSIGQGGRLEAQRIPTLLWQVPYVAFFVSVTDNSNVLLLLVTVTYFYFCIPLNVLCIASSCMLARDHKLLIYCYVGNAMSGKRR